MFFLTVEAKIFVIAACLEPPCRRADVQLGAAPHINGCHAVCSAQRQKECHENDQHEEEAGGLRECGSDGTGQRRARDSSIPKGMSMDVRR
jgi:hypothetical protein